MKLFITIIFMLLSITFNSCSNNSNPVNYLEKIDEKIVGFWYKADTVSISQPGPEYYFRGFAITENGDYSDLAVETSTGRLAISGGTLNSLIYANNGLFVRRILVEPGGYLIDTLHYDVSSNELKLYKNFFDEKYFKTELNSVVTAPVSSSLSALIDNKQFQNSKISYSPAAFANKDPDNSLVIKAGNETYSLEIKVRNFTGPGIYRLKGDEAVLMETITDFIVIYFADSSETNLISIDQYNEAGQRVSGTFNFNISKPDKYTRISDGKFDLHLYE